MERDRALRAVNTARTPVQERHHQPWQSGARQHEFSDLLPSRGQHDTPAGLSSAPKSLSSCPVRAFPSLESPAPSSGPAEREHAEPEPENSEVPPVHYTLRYQHRPELWKFVMLIPRPEYTDLPRDALQNGHAEAVYCLLCKTRIMYRRGQHGVGPHIEKDHMAYLHDYDAKVARKRIYNSELKNDFSTTTFLRSNEGDEVHRINAEEQTRINELTALWVAGNLRPLSAVDDSGFLVLVKYLTDNLDNIAVKIPSRSLLRAEIGKQAAELRASLKSLLKRECRFFSMATDIWTSQTATSFLGLTIHYVSPEFSMQSWTLEVMSFPGQHTGQAIADGLSILFRYWGLSPSSCNMLLRDGASNGIVAADRLGVDHMSCAAHSIHLVVAGIMIKKYNTPEATLSTPTVMASADDEDDNVRDDDEDPDDPIFDQLHSKAAPWEQERAINELEEFLDTWMALEPQSDIHKLRGTVQRFRATAVYFHKSPKGWRRLASIQAQRLHQRELRTITDCPTRWNSARDMLVRMVDIEESIHRFFSYLTTPKGRSEFRGVSLVRPTPRDWFTIKCLIELLELFAAATEMLSEEQHPTLCFMMPTLRFLQSGLDNENIFHEAASVEGDQPHVKEVITDMGAVRRTLFFLFQRRFADIPATLTWMCLLDPRLTDIPLISESERNTAKLDLIDAVIEIANGPNESSGAQPDIAADATPSYTSPARKTTTSCMARGIFGGRPERIRDHSSSESTQEQTLRSKCEAEVHLYLGKAVEVVQKPTLYTGGVSCPGISDGGDSCSKMVGMRFNLRSFGACILNCRQHHCSSQEFPRSRPGSRCGLHS